MRTSFVILIVSFFTVVRSCEKEPVETPSVLQEFETTKYFDSEIFAERDLKIYGMWKVFDISGGIHGNGYDPNFEYLEIKKYGIYGFVRNDSPLEYGKIMPALQANEIRLKVDFEKDENSHSFFEDRVKYVIFYGTDTLHLNSPCCDRYNYHFVRVK